MNKDPMFYANRLEKEKAFEWLRSVSLSDSEHADDAACMMWEIKRLRGIERKPSGNNPESAGWVSNEAQYRKVLESIVKHGERQGIKRVVQICDMTLKYMDVFTDSRSV